jgi:hypothetical protein
MDDTPISEMTNEDVLALANAQLPESQKQELNELLVLQRDNKLGSSQRPLLDALLKLYRRTLVRKAQAIEVAVERGLMPPNG